MVISVDSRKWSNDVIAESETSMRPALNEFVQQQDDGTMQFWSLSDDSAKTVADFTKQDLKVEDCVNIS